jgi:hypothetical protein
MKSCMIQVRGVTEGTILSRVLGSASRCSRTILLPSPILLRNELVQYMYPLAALLGEPVPDGEGLI